MAAWARAGETRQTGPQLPLDELQAACDRLFRRVAEAREWGELRDCATELRFLSLHAERLVEATICEYGEGRRREIDAASAALTRVREQLAMVGPAPRMLRGPSFMARRNALYDALAHLRYGLVTLGWARLEKPRGSTLTG